MFNRTDDLVSPHVFQQWLVRIAGDPDDVPPESTILAYLRKGHLPGLKIGGSWQVAASTFAIMALLLSRILRSNLRATSSNRSRRCVAALEKVNLP